VNWRTTSHHVVTVKVPETSSHSIDAVPSGVEPGRFEHRALEFDWTEPAVVPAVVTAGE